jgi:hypothetical protein
MGNYFLARSWFMRVFKEWIKLISQGITVPAICSTIVVQYQWVRVHEQKQHNLQAMFLLLQYGAVQISNLYVASVKQVSCGETDIIRQLRKVVQCWPLALALLNLHILSHVLKFRSKNYLKHFEAWGQSIYRVIVSSHPRYWLLCASVPVFCESSSMLCSWMYCSQYLCI